MPAGKTVKSAIKIGFQKALSAIVDGNITTLIAALVLGIKGIRKRQGICPDTGTWYRAFHVYGSGGHPDLILNAFYRTGLQGREVLSVMQKERKTINFLGKTKGILYRFPGSHRHRSGFHGHPQIRKGGDILNYSLEFKGGTSTTVTIQR